MELEVILSLIIIQLAGTTLHDLPGSRISYRGLVSLPLNQSRVRRESSVDIIDTETLIVEGRSIFYETLLQQSLAHFNRERIPERVVHAKGSTFYGEFRVTNPEASRFTRATVFAPDKRTRLAVRFSTSVGERGSSDTPLGEVRGMAVKFYTEDGIYDLLCINTPVFFVSDPQLFIHLNHAQKRDPQTDLRSADNLWDFLGHRPESLNGLVFVFSDFGLPDGYEHMPAFSVNTFRVVNHANKAHYARFMFVPDQGVHSLNLSEAIRLAGADPDYARRALFESIENGAGPSWTLYMQLITLKEVERFAYNPFDATKLWPIEEYPPLKIGQLTLTSNVANAFAENEQIALNPGNLVPGIEPSPDRLLRARLFAYRDTHLYRLGANHLLIPVNRDPHRPLYNERDGPMRTDGNFGSTPNYWPNYRFADRPDLYEIAPDPAFSFEAEDITLLKPDSRAQQYSHARESYLSLPLSKRESLHHNLAFALSSITKPAILDRILYHLSQIDPAYVEGVQQELYRYTR